MASFLSLVSFVQLIVNITGTQASSLCTLHLMRLLRRSGNLWSDCSQTLSPHHAKKGKGSEKNWRIVESTKMKNTKEDFICPGKRVLGG